MKQPWEHNPALDRDKIIALASLIKDTRNNVAQLHDGDLGDTEKGTGLRVYECCRTKINNAATDNLEWPFLGIIKSDGRFTFSIDSVPIRLYKGSPNSPLEKRLIPCAEAINQMNFLFDEVGDSSAIIWLFAIETNESRGVDKISLTGYYEGSQVSCYEVPLNKRVPSLGAIDKALPSPTGVKRVSINIKKDKQRKQKVEK